MKCQFCRQVVGRFLADGRPDFFVPVVPYQDRFYCPPCFEKLKVVAQRTGGQL